MTEHHSISCRTLTGVWLALLALTAVTVGVTRLDLGSYRVVAALAIFIGLTLIDVLYRDLP